MSANPIMRHLGDGALLVEFGARIDADVHRQVMAWDAALTANPPSGMLESVPAYASLMIAYDNVVTDPERLKSEIDQIAHSAPTASVSSTQHCIPVGSVMIAGGQCLITTLPMPTGWWVIGQSPAVILDSDSAHPFLFQPGDRVRFERIGTA